MKRVTNLQSGISNEVESYSQAFEIIEEECINNNYQFSADDIIINNAGNSEMFIYTWINDLEDGPTFVIS